MRVSVYEDNLLWSSRLLKSLRHLNCEPVLYETPVVDANPIAIVNLGSAKLDPQSLVPLLAQQGVVVIGHAGHKEKDLLQLGKECGCAILATNSELTFKLEAVLAKATLLLSASGSLD